MEIKQHSVISKKGDIVALSVNDIWIAKYSYKTNKMTGATAYFADLGEAVHKLKDMKTFTGIHKS